MAQAMSAPSSMELAQEPQKPWATGGLLPTYWRASLELPYVPLAGSTATLRLVVHGIASAAPVKTMPRLSQSSFGIGNFKAACTVK